ncbi:hypothetical protein SJI19_19545 [Acerihabitans sp. TG2]|uniref:hypothetical protein n=1 Tax=Acerihabitans sp. TG2 TaxID=3096008 RepID=UPI002B23BDFC|nr:hypothetical protein [Acerihabitans sp. TG2]MEA9392703.1 hypothetical protein [Acerihabitans sp. TG2]
MNKLPVVALFFMSGIVANCLRQLLAYSPSLTHQVLVIATFSCLMLAGGVFIVAEIRRHRKSREQNREAKL